MRHKYTPYTQLRAMARRIRRHIALSSMAFYVKAFSLVVKTASKPLAKALKARISDSPWFRTVAIDAARKAHAVQALIMRDAPASDSGFIGGRKARKIAAKVPVMSEDAALQAASEFAGEAFVFAVAGGVVWWEVDKGNAKDEKRRADAAAERAQLCEIIDTQHSTMRDMKELIQELLDYKASSSELIAQLVQKDGARGARA